MKAKEALKEFESIISMEDILRIESNQAMWQIIKKELDELEKLKELLKYYEAYRKGVIEYIKSGHKNSYLITSNANIIQNFNKGEKK